jgi:opacity protein-like surface antigen
MTDHLFDTFVRDKLADHSSPVPGGLWEKIEAATAEKEKKKGFALIPAAYKVAALLIVCVAAATIAFWPQQLIEKKEITQQESNHPHTNSTAGTTHNNNGQKTIQDSSSDNNNGASAEITGATTGTGQQKTTQQGEATTTGVTSSILPPPARPANSSSTANKATHNRYTADPHNEHNELTNTGAVIAQASGTTDNNTIASNTAEQQFSFLQAEMISLKTLSSYQSTGLLQLLNTQSYKLLPVIRCPTVRNTVPKDLYIEAYASPDLILKNTSANYGGADYLARKDSSQRMRTSFTAGVRISKALTENLLIKTGFQYSQANEVFDYRSENERKQITVITIRKIPQSPGDTIFIRDTTSYEQIGYLQKKTYNKYKSIDIPVIFSYEWGNDQWRLAANVGAIVNIHSWYNGEMLDTSYRAVSVKNSTNGDVYKSNIGLGLYAGFSIIKPVTEKMDLFAEPYFRYNLGDMTNKGQPFNQRLHTAGLSLGIRYRLNGGQHY